MTDTTPMDRPEPAPGTAAGELVARLRGRFGTTAFDVVEQWDRDVCAVGVMRPGDRARLVYISTCDLPTGRFDVSLDEPGNTAEYPAGRGHHAAVDFERVTAIVAEHLGIHPRAE